jgi:hypothetical protein
MLELKEAADVIPAVAFDQTQGALGKSIRGFLSWENAGQILFAQINDWDQFGIAADAALMDFLVHGECRTLAGRKYEPGRGASDHSLEALIEK